MGVVGREAFEASVARVVAQVRDPKIGLHGPGTMSWRISREPVVFLGGGAAALLQLAHPFVGYAVAEHSRTQSDPVGRFQRTFEYVYAIVFGDLEHALQASRRVRMMHERISGVIGHDGGAYVAGQPYAANDEDALLWVHATLIHTAVQVYERAVAPLDRRDKERYWDESKRFAGLFGLAPDRLPRRWTDFESYFHDTVASDAIVVMPPAAELCRFLFRPKNAGARPFTHWYRAMTASLLPTKVREQYGLPHGAAERALTASSLRAARLGVPLLPRRAREVPAYVEARHRLAGRPRSDRFGRALEEAVLKAIRPAPAR
ncbi:MAG: DUF2236 domain-containing protein [Sandaracinus sp.]|nr:DUF2236 domain-containing protein [Sandaracinus sp.]